MIRRHPHHPAARAADLLGEPWTPLLVGSLAAGELTLGQLALRVPGLSRPSLGHRLRRLTTAGIISQAATVAGSRPPADLRSYRLTPAGREFLLLLDQAGAWSRRWLPPPSAREVCPEHLLASLCHGLDPATAGPAALPARFTVIDTPVRSTWWLVADGGAVTPRRTAPDNPVAVSVEATATALIDIWLGRSRCLDELRRHTIRFTGPRAAVRTVAAWLTAGRYHAARPAPAR
ncbi:winged helix-turn-helix transcriptional regulator [Amycolatopsis suaedae]|uniref:winged helix-turn-helix transcriptional regulator n=1 Tax=Amycolatopsis suaedae TaxID=2510978 RepID=UPI0013EF2193|nr:helix-turn-helix domain-containing protein [Amycolatopsis suaedae]